MTTAWVIEDSKILVTHADFLWVDDKLLSTSNSTQLTSTPPQQWQPKLVSFSDIDKPNYYCHIENMVDLQLPVNQFGTVKAPKYAMDLASAKQLGIEISTEDVWLEFRYFLDKLPITLVHGLSRAIQLLHWQANHKFCSRCGQKTVNHASGEYAKVCGHCQYHQYPRIQPCVIVAIIRVNQDTQQQEILLAHHHRHATTENPMYGLVAGFVEVGETLENAVCREVQEEVGLSVGNLRYIASQPWAYPSNLMIGFVADYQAGDLVLQQDELADAQFFSLDNLPNIPQHGTIARTLIELVKSGEFLKHHQKDNDFL